MTNQTRHCKWRREREGIPPINQYEAAHVWLQLKGESLVELAISQAKSAGTFLSPWNAVTSFQVNDDLVIVVDVVSTFVNCVLVIGRVGIFCCQQHWDVTLIYLTEKNRAEHRD